jgi:hypothetical protein
MPSVRAPPTQKLTIRLESNSDLSAAVSPSFETVGGGSMKRVYIFSIAIFALIVSRGWNAFAAGEGKISLSTLEGGYVSNGQGTVAICLDPATFVEVACTTSGALAIPFTSISTGRSVVDSKGKLCTVYSEVESNLPPDASPPLVRTIIVVGKITNYDPASSTGDIPFTTYVGGQCKGSTFDSTGAVLQSTGNFHLVVSQRGNRWDGNFTALTDATGGIGDFNFSFVNLKQ